MLLREEQEEAGAGDPMLALMLSADRGLPGGGRMAGEREGGDRRRRQLKSRAGTTEEGNPLRPSQHLHSGQRHRHRRQRQSLPPPLPGGAAAAARTLLPLLLAVIFIGELIKLPLPPFYYKAGRSKRRGGKFSALAQDRKWKRGRKVFKPNFSAVFLFSSLLHCANCNSSATFFLALVCARVVKPNSSVSPRQHFCLSHPLPSSPCSQNTYSLFPSSLPLFFLFFWRVALGIPDSPQSFLARQKRGGKYVHNRVEGGGRFWYIQPEKSQVMYSPHDTFCRGGGGERRA